MAKTAKIEGTLYGNVLIPKKVTVDGKEHKLKKEMIAEFNGNLRNYMNTMAMVNPEVYKLTTKTIGELVNKNNELVKRRSKTGEPDSELA